MTYRVQAIILDIRPSGEKDRLYTLYTRELGKVTVLGQGTRKISSKLSGHLGMLNVGVCNIARGKRRDRIATIDVVYEAHASECQIEVLAVLLYCTEIFLQMVKDLNPDERLFDLMRDFVVLGTHVEEEALKKLARWFLFFLFIELGLLDGAEFVRDAAAPFLLEAYSGQALPAAQDRMLQIALLNNVEYQLRSEAFFRDESVIGAWGKED